MHSLILAIMTLYEFNLMDTDDQIEMAIWEGNYVDSRVFHKYRIMLYQVDSFYVEIFYEGDGNIIARHRSFSSLEPLDPYINHISLEGLT